jgi:hypothetical protein
MVLKFMGQVFVQNILTQKVVLEAVRNAKTLEKLDALDAVKNLEKIKSLNDVSINNIEII